VKNTILFGKKPLKAQNDCFPKIPFGAPWLCQDASTGSVHFKFGFDFLNIFVCLGFFCYFLFFFLHNRVATLIHFIIYPLLRLGVRAAVQLGLGFTFYIYYISTKPNGTLFARVLLSCYRWCIFMVSDIIQDPQA